MYGICLQGYRFFQSRTENIVRQERTKERERRKKKMNNQCVTVVNMTWLGFYSKNRFICTQHSHEHIVHVINNNGSIWLYMTNAQHKVLNAQERASSRINEKNNLIIVKYKTLCDSNHMTSLLYVQHIVKFMVLLPPLWRAAAAAAAPTPIYE